MTVNIVLSIFVSSIIFILDVYLTIVEEKIILYLFIVIIYF